MMRMFVSPFRTFGRLMPPRTSDLLIPVDRLKYWNTAYPTNKSTSTSARPTTERVTVRRRPRRADRADLDSTTRTPRSRPCGLIGAPQDGSGSDAWIDPPGDAARSNDCRSAAHYAARSTSVSITPRDGRVDRARCRRGERRACLGRVSPTADPAARLGSPSARMPPGPVGATMLDRIPSGAP